jgi:uncharacterized protein
MALQLSRESNNEFTITAFNEKSVRIGETTFNAHVAVSHSVAAHAWPAGALSAEALAHARTLDAEIVIVGTGAKHVFPKPDALRPIIEARIGFEVMHSAAACRTYNVLLSEGRKVGLLLMINEVNELAE